ncbi:hypothetical protein [Streptomyces anulatus]|uniref:hypothetical protein n=1 Tax=Streptomyces anulatus TaxID=1892 RepID=UPI003865068A
MRLRKKRPPEPAEEQFLRLVADGDRAAFDELYRRTSPWPAVRLRRRSADEQIVAEAMKAFFESTSRSFLGYFIPPSYRDDSSSIAARQPGNAAWKSEALRRRWQEYRFREARVPHKQIDFGGRHAATLA